MRWALGEGEYLLRLHAEARENTSLTVTANHRRFLLRSFPLRVGEARDFRFALAVREADFQKRPPYRDGGIELEISGGCRVSAEIEPAELPVVYCLGDSTVCDQEYAGGDELTRCCGWGQTLGLFLGDRYALSNHAEQGTHTADCLACHFPPVQSRLRRGDTVAIQFGHNDQKQSFLKPFGGYKDNLIRLARLTAERGARPVICTPINRLIYVDGRLNDYLDSYAEAAREAAREAGAGLIDLHAYTSEAYVRMGKEAEGLFYHSPKLDRTHPNDRGAIFIGAKVAEELLRTAVK